MPAPDPVRCCERLAGLPYRLFLDSARRAPRLGRYSFLTADPVTGRAQPRTAPSRCVDRAGGESDRRRRRRARRRSTDMLRAVRRSRLCRACRLSREARPDISPTTGAACSSGCPSPRYDDLALADVVLGVYDWVLAWDHAASTRVADLDRHSRDLEHRSIPARAKRARAAVREALARHRSARRGADPDGRRRGRADVAAQRRTPRPIPSRAAGGIRGLELRSSFTRGAYLEAVARVREYVLRRRHLPGQSVAALRGAARASRRGRSTAVCGAGMPRRSRRSWIFPSGAVLSASPERFLRVDRAGHVETRPIKGTRPRGIGPEHDAALGQALTESAKDRAENLMIVDLMRNDLSRVCAPGTVRVPELFALERYATVHHLVSTVVGDLAPGRDALDLLRAAFPGGSITGAPKVRAMEIIAELEPSRRGVYCGSIGYWSVTGELDTSIAIRTAVALRRPRILQRRRRHRRRFGSGAGVSGDARQGARHHRRAGRCRYDSPHRQLRLVRPQPGAVRPRAGRRGRACAATTSSRSATSTALAPSHIILSPGPCSPGRSRAFRATSCGASAPTIPILGVCLGHQCIGAAYGGDIVRAGRPVHGRTSSVAHDGSSVFTGLPSPLRVARYHSLVIARPTLPDELRVLASAVDDGEIMAVEHRSIRSSACSSIPSRRRASMATRCSIASCAASASSAAQLPSRADGARRAIARCSAVGRPGDRTRSRVRAAAGGAGAVMSSGPIGAAHLVTGALPASAARAGALAQP